MLAVSTPSMAQTSPEETSVSDVLVIGRKRNLVGEAISASEGSIGRIELDSRPMLRSGDLLEFVPGLVATQHSGSGKANQYFLRGFNLDHGTDFATFVDGMPVNMRTHGHGQGWTDLNFLIPETVEELQYRKGTYYADVGDFSSTGSARFRIADVMSRGVADLTVGAYGYARGVIVNSAQTGSGDLLYGLEVMAFDGPWTNIQEDVDKTSALLRYSQDVAGGRAHVTVMAYDNSWNSPDQIPARAVMGGLIDAFGSIDTTVGGESSRYSLSAGWRGPAFGGAFSAQAYVIDSNLDLFSNFTYLLDDPVDGDQFEQVDDRRLYGFEVSQQWEQGKGRWRVGADGRLDDISTVGLFHTSGRLRLGTIREDGVRQGSLSLFAANEFQFSDRFRTYLGVRHDRYSFKVEARSMPVNSGEADASATSFKASAVYRPAKPLELYLSYGQGFHSNDARGTTINVDPLTGLPAARVDALVPSHGAEAGARVYFGDQLQATVAVWSLKLDSELLFIGDAGGTEASRPSERAGVEAGLYWFGGKVFSGEIEASYTDAKFRDIDPAGNHIPGSIPLVVSAGLTAKSGAGWLGTLRIRHFGPYPLIEDDSVRSEGSTLVNVRLGREWGKVGLYLDVFNVLDSDDHDIDYYYASRLAGEPASGVDDIHYHAFQPRSLRASLKYLF